MFLGEFSHTIDGKGRLTIPAKFREQLAEGCVVTRGFEKYLLIYTLDAFQRLTVRAKNLSPTDPENRALLRLAFSGASEASLDRQGRVHIPPFLRTYAALETECVVVGVGDYVEVWSRAGWDDQLRVVNDPDTNSQRFAALNLSLGEEFEKRPAVYLPDLRHVAAPSPAAPRPLPQAAAPARPQPAPEVPVAATPAPAVEPPAASQPKAETPVASVKTESVTDDLPPAPAAEAGPEA